MFSGSIKTELRPKQVINFHGEDMIVQIQKYRSETTDVFLVHSKRLGRPYALKRVIHEKKNMYDVGQQKEELQCNELEVLELFKKSKYITNLIDYYVIDKENDKLEFFILLDYYPNGTLQDLVDQERQKGLMGITDEGLLLSIISDIIEGLNELHSRSIAHMNLTLSNIIKDVERWRICDFAQANTQV